MVGKAPKTQQICYYRHTTKTSGHFLLYDTGVGFNSRNNFANLGSFVKVSVPLQYIIPCSYHIPCWELSPLTSMQTAYNTHRHLLQYVQSVDMLSDVYHHSYMNLYIFQKRKEPSHTYIVLRNLSTVPINHVSST